LSPQPISNGATSTCSVGCKTGAGACTVPLSVSCPAAPNTSVIRGVPTSGRLGNGNAISSVVRPSASVATVAPSNSS
jgi:hypothetical protein